MRGDTQSLTFSLASHLPAAPAPGHHRPPPLLLQLQALPDPAPAAASSRCPPPADECHTAGAAAGAGAAPPLLRRQRRLAHRRQAAAGRQKSVGSWAAGKTEALGSQGPGSGGRGTPLAAWGRDRRWAPPSVHQAWEGMGRMRREVKVRWNGGEICLLRACAVYSLQEGGSRSEALRLPSHGTPPLSSAMART